MTTPSISERYGEDAVEALVHALQSIADNLYASDHHQAGHLKSAGWTGGYGFPIAASHRDRLTPIDAKFV